MINMDNPPLTEKEIEEIKRLLDENYDMLVVLS